MKTWSERFDDEIGEVSQYNLGYHEEALDGWQDVTAEVKSFIASELQKQKEEIMEIIKGMKKLYPEYFVGDIHDIDGYNEALDDIIKKLEAL